MKDILIDQMNLEKDIELAAKEYAESTSVRNIKSAFIAGTLCPIIKVYHTKDMYSESEVKTLLFSAWKTATNFGNSVNYEDWFNQYKKK